MTTNKRDLAIIKDLERFRVLSRDDIIDLHFSHLKQPTTGCNTVLKRLTRDGHIERNTNQQPYLYFPSPSPIKKDSTKIPHFLKIVEFYKSLLKYEVPKQFIVEPKYGPKGTVEPDIFMLFKNSPFFVEIQRNIYSEKVMNDKFNRYEAYYHNNKWQDEPWQRPNKKVFPTVIMITDTRYNINSENIKVYQVQGIDQLVKPQEPIQIRVGPN